MYNQLPSDNEYLHPDLLQRIENRADFFHQACRLYHESARTQTQTDENYDFDDGLIPPTENVGFAIETAIIGMITVAALKTLFKYLYAVYQDVQKNPQQGWPQALRNNVHVAAQNAVGGLTASALTLAGASSAAGIAGDVAGQAAGAGCSFFCPPSPAKSKTSQSLPYREVLKTFGLAAPSDEKAEEILRDMVNTYNNLHSNNNQYKLEQFLSDIHSARLGNNQVEQTVQALHYRHQAEQTDNCRLI